MNPSSVMRWLEGMHGPLPYAALFAVAFAEHALLIGTLVPGEVILPLAGVVAATTGALAWLPAALCASVGGFLTDQLAYWLARFWTTRRDERAPGRAGGTVRETGRDGPRALPAAWDLDAGAGTVCGWGGAVRGPGGGLGRHGLPPLSAGQRPGQPALGAGDGRRRLPVRRPGRPPGGPWRWAAIAATATLFALASYVWAIGSELARSTAAAATGPGQGRR